ncbi:unnamed protein product, partial [Pocillopora meandrina]
MEIQVPNCKTVHLFHCDNTFKLDSIEALLTTVKDKVEFEISIKKHCFKLSEMSSVSDSKVPILNMDFAVFVVHANESRLSINEDNAGIGYAKIYKALLRATGESCVRLFGVKCERCFLIENLYVRKDYDQPLDRSGYVIDNRYSKIFSWHKNHREIHEKALLHFFEPSKMGEKFDYHGPEMSLSADTSNATAEENNQGLNPQPEITQSTPSNVPENISVHPRLRNGDRAVAPELPRRFSLLLDTRLRHGEVSDDARDVVHREDGWQVPEGYRDHLRSIHAAETNLRVKFVVRQN